MTQPNPKSKPNSSLLKEARLTKGLTLEIVHEATKIPLDALKAIEEGYSTRILTPFYYRGFIKIYAEFLGLNVPEVLKEYNVQAPYNKSTGQAPTAKPVLKSTPSSPPSVLSQRPNIFLDQAQDFQRRLLTAKNRKNLLRIIAMVAAVVIVVRIVGCVTAAIKSRPKNPKIVVQMKEIKKQHPFKKEQPKTDEETAVVSQSVHKVSAESENHKVTLTARAAKDSRIQVKADGKVVFQMTMKKGTMENWEAQKQIELSGRNINALDLEVNGKHIGSLGSFNHRVKMVLITKEGLTVKK
ncbi:MAG: DUF4115 domain-containing protein [Candidatus Omnitrophica bacterium]|nr:DUF4115 domain-containing protein [Candidatus Omnitrophota bacterium]